MIKSKFLFFFKKMIRALAVINPFEVGGLFGIKIEDLAEKVCNNENNTLYDIFIEGCNKCYSEMGNIKEGYSISKWKKTHMRKSFLF